MRNLQFAKNGVKYCEIYLTGTHTKITHTYNRHTHTHTLSLSASYTCRTIWIYYEHWPNLPLDRLPQYFLHSDSVDSRLCFIYLIFLFFIFVFYLVRFGMTLTLSWEICLYIRNVAQKFYCINCCCYIFGTHSGQTDRNCLQ